MHHRLIYLLACAFLCFAPQIAFLGEMKDMKDNSMFEEVNSRIPRNETIELPVLPELRPRSMNVAKAYVRSCSRHKTSTRETIY